ncbi:MAG: HAMP domain-containing histidine kinase, partial [Holophagales bacterium]|nr:HAMP domain-containing histidine kinase [Holophagales bacterium]
FWRADTPVATIRSLLERFLGRERTSRALAAYFESRAGDGGSGGAAREPHFADAELVSFAERLLAGTTGAASAHIALASVAQEQALSVREVLHLLDETARVIATSRQLEEKSRELEAATSELRAANERLRELDRLKDDFLATMAHELRTPLTSIRSFTEILFDNPELETEKRRRFLSIVLEENERLTRLISQILDLAKIEAGEPIEGRAEVDLNELVRAAVASVARLAEERRRTVEIRCDPGPLGLRVDRDRMMQVLLNLLSNALEHGRSWIGVEVAADSEWVEVSVADDGPGIPPAQREPVFEKFHRITGPSAGRSGREARGGSAGTGLGLPICRGIVEGHGGRIWVETSERGGARLVFLLPIDSRSPPASTQPVRAAPSGASTPRGDSRVR